MNETKLTCWECSCFIEEGDEILVNGEAICQDCYDDNYVTCEHCGDIEHIDDTHYIDETVVCDYCYSRLYETCERCGATHHANQMFNTRDGYVCENCFNDWYVECRGCGEILHVDDADYCESDSEYYCSECYPDSRYINDYYHKPSPIFYGDNDKMYMGVELEIDGAGEDSDNAGVLLDIDGNDRIYCKHDGSLEEGFEIVSHPCTLEYHQNKMEWESIMLEAVEMGYTSHNAGTCGLHIHVSKSALGDTYNDQEKTISNILYFMEKYWSKFLVFSRRTEEQLNRWASRYGLADGEKPADMLKKAKANYNRYKAVNLQNSHTIEFRFFRGTLKYSTFIATLQLVKHLCDMCKYFSDADIEQISWNEFINSIENADADYSELLQYLNDKKISREDF